MSDTPRTDDQMGYGGSNGSFVRTEFARRLERENNDLKRQLAEARELLNYVPTFVTIGEASNYYQCIDCEETAFLDRKIKHTADCVVPRIEAAVAAKGGNDE